MGIPFGLRTEVFGSPLNVPAIWLCVALAIFPTIWIFLRLTDGPRIASMRRRSGLCVHCGYNLTGNTSGVCPECGRSTTAIRTDKNSRAYLPRWRTTRAWMRMVWVWRGFGFAAAFVVILWPTLDVQYGDHVLIWCGVLTFATACFARRYFLNGMLLIATAGLAWDIGTYVASINYILIENRGDQTINHLSLEYGGQFSDIYGTLSSGHMIKFKWRALSATDECQVTATFASGAQMSGYDIGTRPSHTIHIVISSDHVEIQP